jgi:hypothetical protein
MIVGRRRWHNCVLPLICKALPEAQALLGHLAGLGKPRHAHTPPLHCPPCCRVLGAVPAGMAFQSGVATVGSTPHLALTWLVAVVLVACIFLFLGMLAIEVWRSVLFARRVHAVRRASTVSSPVGRASRPSRKFTDNPLHAQRSSATPSSDAAVTVADRGPQTDPGGQPYVEASEGVRGDDHSTGRAAHGDASARVHAVGRPPPPPPRREGGPMTGLLGTAASSSVPAPTILSSVDVRSRHMSRGPQAAAASRGEAEAGRDGRVKRLRSAAAGAPPAPQPPSGPRPEFTTALGAVES